MSRRVGVAFTGDQVSEMRELLGLADMTPADWLKLFREVEQRDPERAAEVKRRADALLRREIERGHRQVLEHHVPDRIAAQLVAERPLGAFAERLGWLLAGLVLGHLFTLSQKERQR